DDCEPCLAVARNPQNLPAEHAGEAGLHNRPADDEQRHNCDDSVIGEACQRLIDSEQPGEHQRDDDAQSDDVHAHPFGDEEDERGGQNAERQPHIKRHVYLSKLTSFTRCSGLPTTRRICYPLPASLPNPELQPNRPLVPGNWRKAEYNKLSLPRIPVLALPQASCYTLRLDLLQTERWTCDQRPAKGFHALDDRSLRGGKDDHRQNC